MTRIAILVGNTRYDALPRLNCCHDDLEAMKTLLETSRLYENVISIENANADDLKKGIRAAIEKVASPEELFFYFSGHGYQFKNEFFHCSTNFDIKRPNETGLSNLELHTMLRISDASLVVKVIDACNSGSTLIKSDSNWLPVDKASFKNVIVLASCLDSQNSLTGDPLSVFTERFRAAALRKKEGPVFYTDIINTLRDDFYQDDFQTPFFILQTTGREVFVEDAEVFNHLRNTLARLEKDEEAIASGHEASVSEMTLLRRLEIAEAKAIDPENLTRIVSNLFSSLIAKFEKLNFKSYFEDQVIEHRRYDEGAAEKFMIRVLSKENRPDNFVSASHTKRLKNRNPNYPSFLATSLSQYLDPDAFEESWYLNLNYTMEKAQIKFILTPLFVNIQRIEVIISCAPSLNYLYIFENSTKHKMRDFRKYEQYGEAISERWWKIRWDESFSGIVDQIGSKLVETIEEMLSSTESRLSKE